MEEIDLRMKYEGPNGFGQDLKIWLMTRPAVQIATKALEHALQNAGGYCG
jgi:hypothetical protein